MTARVRSDGLSESIDETEEQALRAADLSPVLAVIAEDLKTFVDDRFETSTDPTGAPWDPLAPATVAARRGSSAKPLIDTGTLRNSITTEFDALSILLGTNVPYAGPHQFGTARIPMRPFFPVTEDGDPVAEGLAESEWIRFENMIADYIETGEITEGE